MTEIVATYHIVTPLFCGGADPSRPELRLPSFKGVLRFWWRALAWSHYGGDLPKVKAREDALFGSAATGRARVELRLVPSARSPDIVDEGAVLDNPKAGVGARYLGYGLMEAFGRKAGKLMRGCIRAPLSFTVVLRCRHFDEDDDAELLERALRALGTFGGMGARSRRGYGSLVLHSLSGGPVAWQRPASVDQLNREIREIVGVLRPGQFETAYTAFSSEARVVLAELDREREPLELLDLVGREMVRYRSWGKDGTVLGTNIAREEIFKDDHDLMRVRRLPNKYPRRIAFGLPHNYGKPPKDKVGPSDPNYDRRASPLFIHMHQCNKRPIAVLTFLPARFLPPRAKALSVGAAQVQLPREAQLYAPIGAFMDRMCTSAHQDPTKRRKEPFSGVTEVQW